MEAVSSSSRRVRARLFNRRAQRPRPHLDDKILTAWNGLMISALSKAGAAFCDLYVEAALKAANFLRSDLTTKGGLCEAGEAKRVTLQVLLKTTRS